MRLYISINTKDAPQKSYITDYKLYELLHWNMLSLAFLRRSITRHFPHVEVKLRVSMFDACLKARHFQRLHLPPHGLHAQLCEAHNPALAATEPLCDLTIAVLGPGFEDHHHVLIGESVEMPCVCSLDRCTLDAQIQDVVMQYVTEGLIAVANSGARYRNKV